MSCDAHCRYSYESIPYLANRILSESMRVVISRHPSLQDLKYVNDVSSVLVAPLLLTEDQQEHVYQELIRCDLGLTTPTADLSDNTDDDKENRPPSMPIRSHVSRIPVWTSSTHKRNSGVPMMATLVARDTDTKGKKPTVMAPRKPNLTGECLVTFHRYDATTDTLRGRIRRAICSAAFRVTRCTG